MNILMKSVTAGLLLVSLSACAQPGGVGYYGGSYGFSINQRFPPPPPPVPTYYTPRPYGRYYPEVIYQGYSYYPERHFDDDEEHHNWDRDDRYRYQDSGHAGNYHRERW